MPTLSNLNGASLVADISPALGTLVGSLGTKRERDKEAGAAATQAAIQEQAGIATSTTGEEQQQAILRLTSLDPAIAKGISSVLASGDERVKATILQEAEKGFRQALFVKSQPDFASQQKALTSIGEEIIANGGDPTKILELQNLGPAELALELDKMEIMGQDMKSLLKSSGQVEDQRAVQSSKILPGGVVQITYKNGDIEVKEADPAELALVRAAEARGVTLAQAKNEAKALGTASGEEAAIIKANEDRIELERQIAEIEVGKKKTFQSIAVAKDKFKQIAPLRKNIANIGRAIQAIDEGAETGAIDKFLPNIKTASVKLGQVIKELGLDVVGSVTFGALSEGELQLALDVGVPEGLQPQELRKWLIEKRNVQEKLLQGINDSVLFLMGGGTIADLVRRGQENEVIRQEQQGAPTTTQTPATGQIKFLGFE